MPRDWDRHYQEYTGPTQPARVVRRWGRRIPAGPLLDVAGGLGRNAFYLARLGHPVTILERSPVALAQVAAKARRTGLPVILVACDLEQPEVALPVGLFAGVIMTYFKAVPLLPRLAKHLTPGGLLLVEGFTVIEAARKGSSPEHYWHEGELPALLSGLTCLEYGEAWLRGRHRGWGVWQHSASR
ncbi:MAG: class I SAM-dependent methyltransferase [Truepera sp.]|nr:class I SAM-dependent methyltransferase [Truepera sp.]